MHDAICQHSPAPVNRYTAGKSSRVGRSVLALGALRTRCMRRHSGPHRLSGPGWQRVLVMPCGPETGASKCGDQQDSTVVPMFFVRSRSYGQNSHWCPRSVICQRSWGRSKGQSRWARASRCEMQEPSSCGRGEETRKGRKAPDVPLRNEGGRMSVARFYQSL